MNEIVKPEVLTVQETAEILRVHPQTVYRYLRDGVLRGSTARKQIKILRQEINRFLAGEEIR